MSAAQNDAADDRADLEADTASQAVTADVLHLAAHPDRAQFALRNHRDAVLHFTKMAAEAERLASMCRGKIEEHIHAARQRVSPAEFQAWLNEIQKGVQK